MLKLIRNYSIGDTEENNKYRASIHIKDDYRKLLQERLQKQIQLKKAREDMMEIEGRLEVQECTYGHILFGA